MTSPAGCMVIFHADCGTGPSGTQMNEIAQMTYNQQDFVEIMEMLDKRLNDKGKNWRHVFKVRPHLIFHSTRC